MCNCCQLYAAEMTEKKPNPPNTTKKTPTKLQKFDKIRWEEKEEIPPKSKLDL